MFLFDQSVPQKSGPGQTEGLSTFTASENRWNGTDPRPDGLHQTVFNYSSETIFIFIYLFF